MRFILRHVCWDYLSWSFLQTEALEFSHQFCIPCYVWSANFLTLVRKHPLPDDGTYIKHFAKNSGIEKMI